MIDNPFTPVFGGKPDSFFGRKELLARFDRALEVRGSDDRSLFFTGTRGSGKTALLEQLSMRAVASGWRAIDIGAEQALQALHRELAGYDEVTETVSPSLEVKVLGSGGSVSGKSTARTTRYEMADLASLLRKAAEKEKKGLFVSVDEIQKVPLEEVASLCEAFQMASRKGFDVILAVAGLPFSYEAIIRQDGCMFMRRSVHEPLGLLDVEEVQEAYRASFDKIERLEVRQDAFERLVHLSSGHPYMMQLLGYQLIEQVAQRDSKKIVIDKAIVETVAPAALDSYERRALRPLLDELSERERAYLRAMAQVADSSFLSSTGSVAEHMGKTAQQVAPARQSLIDKGIIVSAGYGLVRFGVPYLRAYMAKPSEEEANLAQLEAWGI
ncbi:ATP-binding protein [Adlercreutzia caecimuris]|uniref:ATP-binding protein n=1 Tax=Adlercreutzia caecimuris TaxID=671266 RepID=UPI00137281FD|nr:ATP-binding protein [Adlercreutzia caecimuris]